MTTPLSKLREPWTRHYQHNHQYSIIVANILILMITVRNRCNSHECDFKDSFVGGGMSNEGRSESVVASRMSSLLLFAVAFSFAREYSAIRAGVLPYMYWQL